MARCVVVLCKRTNYFSDCNFQSPVKRIFTQLKACKSGVGLDFLVYLEYSVLVAVMKASDSATSSNVSA